MAARKSSINSQFYIRMLISFYSFILFLRFISCFEVLFENIFFYEEVYSLKMIIMCQRVNDVNGSVLFLSSANRAETSKYCQPV